jgi:hypothetical protein
MPERSENIPPSAAKISGVANRIVENKSDKVNNSLILSFGKFLQRSHKQNHHRLQNFDQIFGNVFGKRINENSAAQKIAKNIAAKKTPSG